MRRVEAVCMERVQLRRGNYGRATSCDCHPAPADMPSNNDNSVTHALHCTALHSAGEVTTTVFIIGKTATHSTATVTSTAQCKCEWTLTRGQSSDLLLIQPDPNY